MIKWCYLGIISFNGSDRSGQILFWGFFCSDAKPKKAGKNILGQNFLRFSLAKWNQKTHHAKALNEPKCFIPPKLNVLCYDYSCLFFFFNWVTLWMNKLRNFICKPLECKDFPCSKIYSCTLSQEFMWIQPEFTHCFNFFVKFAACGKYPPALFLLLLNWFLNFLPALSVRFFSYFYRFSFDFVFFWWRTFQFFPLMI